MLSSKSYLPEHVKALAGPDAAGSSATRGGGEELDAGSHRAALEWERLEGRQPRRTRVVTLPTCQAPVSGPAGSPPPPFRSPPVLSERQAAARRGAVLG